MQNKLISNREMFRQLLARDIFAILEDVNAGTWVDMTYLRRNLGNKSAARHYMNLHTSRGHGFTTYGDRFYRAMQSINDKGYGLTVRKDKQTNRLFVFSTKFADNYVESIADMFEDWTTCYKSNRGYEINTAKDEAVA